VPVLSILEESGYCPKKKRLFMATSVQGRSHIESFYHLSPDISGNAMQETTCQGTACFVARHLNPALWQRASLQTGRVYCLGKCYLAPASGADEGRPRIETHARETILLKRLLDGGAPTLTHYTLKGGYHAIQAALSQSPEQLVQSVASSGLRGRGGAGFPTGEKWRKVLRESAAQKFVVANADEGDPGAYMERLLLEGDPHCLIEAMLIAGYATGAAKGFIYLRKEYPQAAVILRRAIEEAREERLLGAGVLNRRFSFEIELVMGRGSYVCGEETALLNSIEGKRPEPRQRPPYATTDGLYGQPTLINNVETLCNIPWIVLNGGEAYHRLGFSNSRGTKLVSLNSLFRRPGLYEIEFGMTLRRIVDDLGGGLKTGELKGVIIGGPLAGIVPPELLDTAFGFEELRAIGGSVGHGGIVAFDEHTSIPELIHHVFDFGAYESCGKCTPCRLGARRVEQIFARRPRSPEEAEEFRRIARALDLTSFCGLGTGLAEFAESALRHYPKEIAAWVA
jgi:NADH:ubiquinone oxidoreductase subunit F (NADH-binding)